MNTPELAALPNPFTRAVVDGPRDAACSAQHTVESIHQAELARIVQAFNTLAAQPLPRLQAGPLTWLLLSQTAGSGKSHLLGRLWRSLGGRATVVFLRGHQDGAGFWRRMLDRLVQELESPEAPDQRALASGGATQLDCLARHLLADLMAQALAQGRLKASLQMVQEVRTGDAKMLAQLRSKLPTLMVWLNQLVPLWVNQLSAAGLHLGRDPVAWLKVLTCYTVHPPSEAQRGLAVSWLLGDDLGVDEAQQLGLTPAQLRPRGLAQSANESAFQCIRDVCALSAFFRPLVFAFDQTEIYGQSAELARTLGAALGRLQAECLNQFSLVTANEGPWQHSLSQHFEQADLERFDPLGRVLIRGINRPQAEELLTLKLSAAGYPAAAVAQFLAQPWLAVLFSPPGVRPLVREVQKTACLALEAWRQGEVLAPVPGGWPTHAPLTPPVLPTLPVQLTPPAPPEPQTVLAQAFNSQRQRLQSNPKALEFDAGVLVWSVNAGVSKVPGLAVQEGFALQTRKLQACWRTPAQTLFVVLDASQHWKHWQAVVNEYLQLAAPERQASAQVRGVVLWHRSWKPMGEGVRKQIAAAQSAGLSVLELEDAPLATLYAAQALFAEHCQGDLPGVNLPALLHFVAQQLQPWVQQLLGGALVPAPRGDVYLTVSQLVCACARPGWLAAWRQGQAPSTARRGGLVHGARLHLIAQAFAQWVLAPANAPAAAALRSVPAVQARLMQLGGEKLLNQLRRQGQAEAVLLRVQASLQRLAQHFVQARQIRPGQGVEAAQATPLAPAAGASTPPAEGTGLADGPAWALERVDWVDWADWADVLVAQEYALKRVPLASAQGRTVWLSGRLDALRRQAGGGWRIVDYKFTGADEPEEAVLQLALYQRMLLQQYQLRADGCVAYLGEPALDLPCTAPELAQLYSERVVPVLAQLLELPLAPAPEPAVRVESAPSPWPSPTRGEGDSVPAKPLSPRGRGVGERGNAQDTASLKVQLGVQRHPPHEVVDVPLAALVRHSAVLGSSGSGKTTTALHMVEQVLAAGVPAVLLDRKGDLCRYLQPEAWQQAHWPPQATPQTLLQRQALRERLALSLYTPGAIQGRGLRLPLAPAGLAQLPAQERDQAARESATVFAQTLGLVRPADQPKAAVLVCAFQVLARRVQERGITLADVLALLGSEDEELLQAIGILDPRRCRDVAEKVQTFAIHSGSLLDERAELLDWAQLLRPRPDGRVPLSIISTKFLGDEASTLFWVAQFFLELLRYVSRHPASQLQALLMIDEADLYLPATKAPATKAPLMSLLRRARSGGVGLLLCTQSPGDLDYQGRDNIRNWVLGGIREERALSKIQTLLLDSRIAPEQLSRQQPGQFVFAAEGQARAFKGTANGVETQQLPEPEILKLAAQWRLGA